METEAMLQEHGQWTLLSGDEGMRSVTK